MTQPINNETATESTHVSSDQSNDQSSNKPINSNQSSATEVTVSARPPSQNALKAGIYTNRLLPGEDPILVHECIEAYVRDFEISTSFGYQLAQELVQVTLKLNRLESLQVYRVEALLASKQTRQKFAMELGLDFIRADKLPDWYFNGCQESRARARRIYAAYSQLDRLIQSFSIDKLTDVENRRPDLWWFVKSAVGKNAGLSSFSDMLTHLSQETEPRKALNDLKAQMDLSHVHSLNWARSEQRFEAVLNGLRADEQMNMFANPNLQRAEVMLHRKKTDLLSQLLQLKKEAQDATILELKQAEPITLKTRPKALRSN